MKSFVVEVTKGGYILLGAIGKQEFDDMLGALGPRYLDLSRIGVEEQNSESLAGLRECMDKEFEYIGGSTLSSKGFDKRITKYLKNERSKLKKIYMENEDADAAFGVDPQEWARLKIYWRDLYQIEYAMVKLLKNKLTIKKEL